MKRVKEKMEMLREVMRCGSRSGLCGLTLQNSLLHTGNAVELLHMPSKK